MVCPGIVQEQLQRNAETSPFLLDSQVSVRRFFPNRVLEGLLDGFNAGIFVEQCHADNTA